MTISLALEYIPRRVEELCWGQQYHIRLRHFLLQPQENKSIEVDDCIFILVEPGKEISVESDMGRYNLFAYNTEELHYEYQSNLIITNNSTDDVSSVKFIQVIPKKVIRCR